MRFLLAATSNHVQVTRKILEGGTTLSWVYMHTLRNFGPSGDHASKEGIKDGGRQKQKYNLDPSALFTGVSNYLSVEVSQVSARGNVKRNGRP